MKTLKYLAASLLLAPVAVSAQVDTSAQPLNQAEWIDVAALEFGPGEGRRNVQYDLEINERGRVTSCRIAQGSGDDDFDKSVCAQIKKNARFDKPASRVFSDQRRQFRGYFYADPVSSPLP